MAAGASAAELLEAGIEALAHANVGDFEALAEATRGLGAAGARVEQPIAREKLRALGRVLELTHRNLRLLRGIAEYGMPPGANRRQGSGGRPAESGRRREQELVGELGRERMGRTLNGSVVRKRKRRESEGIDGND